MEEDINRSWMIDEYWWKTSNREVVIQNPIKAFESKLSKIDFLKKPDEDL